MLAGVVALAAAFGPPGQVLATHADDGFAQVATAADDSAAVVYPDRAGPAPAVELRHAAPGQPFGAPVEVVPRGGADRVQDAGIAGDGSGVVIGVTKRDLTARWFDPTGRVISTQTLARSASELHLQVARSGAAVVDWGQASGPGTPRLYVAVADPGTHRFGRPHALAPAGRELDDTVAIGDRGDAVVGWAEHLYGLGYTAVRPAGGTFGARQKLPTKLIAAAPTLAVGPDGSAAAAVVSTYDELGDTARVTLVRLAPGRRRFGAPQDLGPPRDPAAIVGSAAITATGHLVYAETTGSGTYMGPEFIQIWDADRGTKATRSQRIKFSPDAGMQLAADDTHAAITFVTADGSIVSALRPAGGSFDAGHPLGYEPGRYTFQGVRPALLSTGALSLFSAFALGNSAADDELAVTRVP